MAIARLAALAVAVGLAFAVAGAEAAPRDAGRIAALLVAGDFSEPVFDNAIRAMRQKLREAGMPGRRIALMSADPPHGIELASRDAVLRRVAALRPGAGGSCLVFLTSHGGKGEGLFLAAHEEFLRPAELDAALEAGCADAPTVVIVSACYSGSFAAPPMTRPNRIVLTAARADRPSFGCAADRHYSFFDECLLQALDGKGTWRAVFTRSRRCVSDLEHRLDAVPSDPRAWFGNAVTDLRAP